METLILSPFSEMMGRVTGFIPTLVMTLGILIIGSIMAVFLTRLVGELFKVISLDKLTDALRISHIIKNGGKHKLSEVLTTAIGWIFMVTVLIMTVNAYGLTTATDLLNGVLAYIPHVVSGAVVLIIGLLVAKIVSSLVHFAASTTGMPRPELISRLSKYAIVIYVAIAYLREVGFVSLFDGAHYTLLITGVVGALAIAFGLAGRDVASRFLDSLKEK